MLPEHRRPARRLSWQSHSQKRNTVTLTLAVPAVPSQDKAPDFPNPARSLCVKATRREMGCEPRTSKLEGECVWGGMLGNEPTRCQCNLIHKETENQNSYGFPSLKHSLDIWRYFQSMLIFPVSFKN